MDEQRNRSRILWATVALITTGLIYALAIGPICWLAEHDMLSEATIEWLVVFYHPLILLLEHEDIPVLPWLLNSYLGWWDAL